VTDAAYREARFGAAESLRRLGHALVDHRPAPDVLHRIEQAVASVIPEVTAAPRRKSALEFLAEEDVRDAIGRGDVEFLLERAKETPMFEDSVVSGRANPLGMAAEFDYEGETAVVKVVLGPAFEGAPGRAHGGVVAAVFDETMGAVLPVSGTLAYTGSLNVRYLAPTPVGTPLEFRARLVSRQGRKVNIEAEGIADGERFAEAWGMYIAVADYESKPGVETGE
jgi:acyl-coenzyme A thioesterase PaaI-like protein